MADWTNATSTSSGVLRPEQLARSTTLRRLPASEAVAGHVENYWVLRWSLPAGATHASETLPHPACTLSVERGRTREGVGPDPVVVTGVPTRRFDVELAGEGWVFAAKFRPGGLAALTGATAADWRDRTLAAVEVLPATVVDRLRDLDADTGDEACADTFDEALTGLVGAPDPDHLLLLELVSDMLGDRSLLSVAQVEQRHGIGTRRLQRLFARYVGATPKWVLARYRMHDAVTALDAGWSGSLADLAAAHGWYDQAHFARDFRRLVGQAPSAYVARRSTTS